MTVFSGSSTKAENGTKTPGISVLASGTKVVGKLISEGTLKIEGTVEGTVYSKTEVFVGKSGLVQGDVRAQDAVVGGCVEGSILAEGRVALHAGSHVDGDIQTPKLGVEEGGSVNGRVVMSAQPTKIGADGSIGIDKDHVKSTVGHGPSMLPHSVKNRKAV